VRSAGPSGIVRSVLHLFVRSAGSSGTVAHVARIFARSAGPSGSVAHVARIFARSAGPSGYAAHVSEIFARSVGHAVVCRHHSSNKKCCSKPNHAIQPSRAVHKILQLFPHPKSTSFGKRTHAKGPFVLFLLR